VPVVFPAVGTARRCRRRDQEQLVTDGVVDVEKLIRRHDRERPRTYD
jgi:hypothetical protein